MLVKFNSFSFTKQKCLLQIMNCNFLKRICSFLASSQSGSTFTLITGLVISYYLPIYGENSSTSDNQLLLSHGCDCDITTIMSESFWKILTKYNTANKKKEHLSKALHTNEYGNFKIFMTCFRTCQWNVSFNWKKNVSINLIKIKNGLHGNTS